MFDLLIPYGSGDLFLNWTATSYSHSNNKDIPKFWFDIYMFDDSDHFCYVGECDICLEQLKSLMNDAVNVFGFDEDFVQLVYDKLVS